MKKKVIFSLVATLIIVSGSAIYTLNNNQRPVDAQNTAAHIQKNDDAAQPQAPTEQTQTTQTASASANQVAVDPVNTPPAQTTPAQPEYGEDPNNPGVYVVFDHTAVMDDAGVPADQQTSADALIKDMMNWDYKLTNYPGYNLCRMNPEAKMTSFGSDYVDNPVTQMKACNAYAAARYGDWNAALSHFQDTKSF